MLGGEKGLAEKGVGHRQRLKDKFHQHGIEAFTDSEVLELLLILGTPRKDCKEQARALLQHFGSLVQGARGTFRRTSENKGSRAQQQLCHSFSA